MTRLCVMLLVVFPTAAAAQDSTPQDPAIRFATELVVTPERTETPRALVPAGTKADGLRLERITDVKALVRSLGETGG